MRVFQRSFLVAIAGLTVVAGGFAADVQADPAADALAKLNELSRQAEQTNEALHSAELDLTNKLLVQLDAEKRHSADQAAVNAAKAKLAGYQEAIDKFAAATYMGGSTDGMSAILTARSPQQLIDKLSVQQVVAVDVAAQLAGYRSAGQQADQAEKKSAQSATEAKTAAEQAAAVSADLQRKQSQLRLQIALVKSQYLTLTPGQRTALAAPGPAPAAVPGAPAPDPESPGVPEGSAPGVIPLPNATPNFGGSEGATAVQAALTQVGTPYAWGGAAPGGFDCSGLVMWAFQQAGIALPHSSQALAHGGQAVSLGDLQPGDVLTFYSDASHAGIYVGDGLMIHSSTYGQPVRVVPMTSSGPIYNARRY